MDATLPDWTTQDGARFRFGAFTLDAATREMRREGQPVALEPKVFDLLLYLVRHADRVVSKAELLHALWAGDAFSPGVLAQCIWSARSAIDDDGLNQSCIRTVRGRGYRFAARVAIESERVAIVSSSTIPLVGRRREVQQCELLLQAAKLGQGAGWWIQGASGWGKTRLLAELARIAVRRGVGVVSGHCYASETVPTFWPFREVIEQLRIAGPALDAQSDPFGSADAIARALQSESARRPLAVFLDDLHFADRGSLAVVELLASARHAPQLLLIATSLPDVDDSKLRALERRSWMRRSRLSALCADEIARDLELSDEAARLLFELTRGHPNLTHWALLTLRQVLAFDGTTAESVLRDADFRSLIAAP